MRLLEGTANGPQVTASEEDLDPFIGCSGAIRRLATETKRFLASDGPILIRGETGTGKTVLARWIHRHSRRAAGPLVPVNCAGLSREASSDELFGHEKGSFPGATACRTGLVESSDRGTLLLDEIGDLDPTAQGKLLRVVEEGRFTRLGGVEERRTDMCLVVTTQRNLERRVAEGTFREDLYFRIERLTLVVPPLRERFEDLPALAERILGTFAPARERGVSLTPGALERLRRHVWRGNARELRNVLERAALLSDEPTVRADDLRLEAGVPAASSEQQAVTLEDVERRHIEQTLAAVDYRVEEAARVLRVPRSTLYQRIRECGIQLRRH
jgi:DNA-binding NtrC family response regulator